MCDAWRLLYLLFYFVSCFSSSSLGLGITPLASARLAPVHAAKTPKKLCHPPPHARGAEGELLVRLSSALPISTPPFSGALAVSVEPVEPVDPPVSVSFTSPLVLAGTGT